MDRKKHVCVSSVVLLTVYVSFSIQDINTAQQSVIQNHVIEFNDLKEMVENHDQKHTDSNLSIIDLKEKATGFENEHAEFRDLIKSQSDTNTAQQEAIENHFGEFDDVKENLEDFGEELAKNQSVIQMKIQAQTANLHPPISHHGSFLLIYPTLRLKHITYKSLNS